MNQNRDKSLNGISFGDLFEDRNQTEKELFLWKLHIYTYPHHILWQDHILKNYAARLGNIEKFISKGVEV